MEFAISDDIASNECAIHVLKDHVTVISDSQSMS